MEFVLTYKLGADDTLRYLKLDTPDPATTLARLQEKHAEFQATGRNDYMRDIALTPALLTPAST